MQLASAIRTDFDLRLLEHTEGRRLLTENDPLLFAAVYLPHKHHASETIHLQEIHR